MSNNLIITLNIVSKNIIIKQYKLVQSIDFKMSYFPKPFSNFLNYFIRHYLLCLLTGPHNFQALLSL